jgi:hypothetical protein
MTVQPKVFETITISKAEYEQFHTLVEQQKAEITALEYRIKTLLSR